MSAIVVPPTVPPAVPPTVHPILGNLSDIQGDVWSKGFPKYNETYYLFTIKQERAADFARALRNMVTHQPHLISNLPTVKNNWAEIVTHKQAAGSAGSKKERLPMPNALIAFTYKGLETIQSGLASPKSLKLVMIRDRTDPSFASGMRSDARLNDPTTDLDPLFADTEVIHGMLKVAGSCIHDVNKRLHDIQTLLGRGSVINDVAGGSEGRLDGATRQEPHRGKEHFGFEDGISQPLMDGVDDDKAVLATPIMVTDPKILLVTKDTRTSEGGIPRPDWMHQGSFLVFRKLEQNVKAFHDLTKDYEKYGCKSPDHMGAKLMGRWPSGAPITVPDYHTSDAPAADHEKVKRMNDFSYERLDAPPHMCPLAAHIRKTNPRMPSDSNNADPGFQFSKMIRSGIPYGPDYKPGEVESPESKRGLLFVCYQGYIELGFQHMQSFWCDNKDFPPGKESGVDPIIGQASSPEDMKTKITEGKEAVVLPTGISQLVTFRGGEYFFVPSLLALRGALSESKV
ncbi:hypothetical protein B0T16DRAFT_463145 [Cercophora newfieldiana]|uniref:Dyp-type peroxidase n=1 Tax=Cercophora newfieldiana TaxID=92897 RepID=A0AA40CJ56_9PEZI|nr:hypothetical protein B0T16DRAFT_463145 [Cercophora newfieldiana]